MITKNDLQFYNENGYLIIRNFLSEEKIKQLDLNYEQLRKKLAKQASIKYSDYQKEICQIRDLWRYDKGFQNLILKDEISKIVPTFFEEGGCRLLHDHFINKPIGNNGIVPWHKDYTSWPIDNSNGLSLWLPFNNLDENSGVLEVIPKSHLLEEDKPVDFINDTIEFADNEIIKLTVNMGDLVILHSMTWHKSSANISAKERKAYISLWIPSDSKYVPKHASWHPVNDNITVATNKTLNDDWFPVIGNTKIKESDQQLYIDNSHTEDMSKITMFNASKVTRKFFQKHLGIKDNIWSHLYEKSNRYNAASTLVSTFNLNNNQKIELDEVLLSMSINGLAYQNHRGRNVYNKSYVKFIEIFENEI
jgi:ectoine hydroxylase-related dioxygenase (phytanoyl-CoA dioxygenase family)